MSRVKKDSLLAWIICFGAFITNFAVIGIDNSFGVVIGSLMLLLGSSTSDISWVHSAHSSSMFLFAAVSTILIKRFGFRFVIFVGTILCCASYAACVFLPNFIGLLIGYGIIGGAGSGLLFTPANIACVHYFDKRKAISTGIAMSGSGIGTMGVSLACNYMNIKYGYKGYFITLCFISSLTLIFALFASPVQNEIEVKDSKEVSNSPTDHTIKPDMKSETTTVHEENKECKTSSKNKQDITVEQRNKSCKSSVALEGQTNGLEPTQKDNHEEILTPISDQILSRDIITTQWDRRRSSIALDAYINAVDVSKKENEASCESISTHTILTLLKDKRMSFYCLVHVLFELAYYVPMIYLPEMMVHDHGLSKEWAGSIISILGLCHMTGRILSGLLVQCSKISPTIFSAISMGLLGTGCIGFTFCKTYEHFVLVTSAYGLILATIDVFLPLILIEMFGDANLKDAYGLVMVGKMFSPMWGPPIGGAFKDWTGRYNVAFYAAGSFQYIGAFFNVLVCIFHFKLKM